MTKRSKKQLLDWEQWMDEVNRYMEERYGLHTLDLDDWHYYDDFSDGISPMQSARRAYKNAGGPI